MRVFAFGVSVLSCCLMASDISEEQKRQIRQKVDAEWNGRSIQQILNLSLTPSDPQFMTQFQIQVLRAGLHPDQVHTQSFLTQYETLYRFQVLGSKLAKALTQNEGPKPATTPNRRDANGASGITYHLNLAQFTFRMNWEDGFKANPTKAESGPLLLRHYWSNCQNLSTPMQLMVLPIAAPSPALAYDLAFLDMHHAFMMTMETRAYEKILPITSRNWGHWEYMVQLILFNIRAHQQKYLGDEIAPPKWAHGPSLALHLTLKPLIDAEMRDKFELLVFRVQDYFIHAGFLEEPSKCGTQLFLPTNKR